MTKDYKILKEIILFGSYAYGKATKDSGIDLLVIMDKKGGRGLQGCGKGI